MRVPEISQVKSYFEELQGQGLVKEWALPYENLLTRLNAAIFFFTPADEASVPAIEAKFGQYEHFSFRPNQEKRLSMLQYRVTFSAEEKEKNALVNTITE